MFVNLHHIRIVFADLLCIFMQKEREKSENHKDCCLRAAVAIELLTRKKTAAWISSALEGKMRAQQRL